MAALLCCRDSDNVVVSRLKCVCLFLFCWSGVPVPRQCTEMPLAKQTECTWESYVTDNTWDLNAKSPQQTEQRLRGQTSVCLCFSDVLCSVSRPSDHFSPHASTYHIFSVRYSNWQRYWSVKLVCQSYQKHISILFGDNEHTTTHHLTCVTATWISYSQSCFVLLHIDPHNESSMRLWISWKHKGWSILVTAYESKVPSLQEIVGPQQSWSWN